MVTSFMGYPAATRTEPAPSRLLEYSKAYFDPETFPEGETKRALKKMVGRLKSKPKATPSTNSRINDASRANAKKK